MRLVTSLLPLAIAIAAVAGVTWFLLTRGWALGPWLLALLLFAHGFVHLVFLFPQPEPAAATAGGLAYPFDMDRSWLIGAGLDGALARTAGTVLMVIVFVLSGLTALATVGLLVPAGWWAPLVVASALSSMLLLTLFFSPLFLLGYAIDLALLWLVVGSVWSPTGA
ncbi:MAG: hypothetical protein AB1Z67_08070 [Candidatus Limnocylindrales bacterium]